MRRSSSDPAPSVPDEAAPPARSGRVGTGARGRIGQALGVAMSLAVFFGPAILGQGDFVYRDSGRLHAPTKRWIADELARGRFPSWNPYAGLGVPVVPTGQDAVEHPFTALLRILPPAAALKAWVLLSFALAAAGALAWAWALGLEGGAAAVAALGFALSGPLVSSSDNVQFLTAYAALPWIFAAAHHYGRRGGPAGLAGLGAAAALCAAAGDPLAWGLGVGVGALYVLAASPAPARWRRAAAAVLATASASAPFVLPLVLWLPHAGRMAGLSVEDRAGWNLHPLRLLELVVPDLLRDDPRDPYSAVFQAYGGSAVTTLPWFLSVYVGAAVAALAALAAGTSRAARVLIAAAAVFAWAALGPYAGFGQLAAHLPVLRALRYWEKLAVWIPLFLGPAAAIGARELARRGRARSAARAFGAVAGVALAAAAVAAFAPGVVAALAGGPPEVAGRLAGNLAAGAARGGLVLFLLAVVATLVARGRLGRAAPAAVALVVALDLLGGTAGAYVLGPPERAGRPVLAAGLPDGARVFSPFSPREDRWPELGRVGSVWEWERRTLGPTWNVPLRIGTEHDYVGLRDARWTQLLAALEASGQTARLGLFGFSRVVVPARPELAARTGAAPPYRVDASDPELPAFLVEVPHRPRAYLAAAPFRTDAAGAMAFAIGGGGDGRTAVEGDVPAGAAGAGDVELSEDLPGATVVRVRAATRALLVLNDLFAPGWTATVDGRPAPILRVNAVARGVWVDAGAHEVRFRYRTPGLALGWGIAALGAAVLAAWALARRRTATPRNSAVSAG